MMPSATLTNSKIAGAYAEMTAKSAALHERALALMPSGLSHDSWYMKPYNIYVANGRGARKWDVDGNEYVDFYGGHGALILGHAHPTFTAAVQAQAERGTQFGTCNALEVDWAGRIVDMIPSAERVRFTGSGTEATQLAIRLARAHTGRNKLIRFQRHYHGWHDHVAAGINARVEGALTPGLLPETVESTIPVAAHDIDAVAELLRTRDDIAAVILEPFGASSGQVPLRPEKLAMLREMTTKAGALLIFDEVVTGFRVSPGGAQALRGVMPDLTTLAKLVAGGLPGGCVAGRADILDWISFEATAANGREKIRHQGTFNGNPMSAAAGIAMLDHIRTTDACAKAAATAAEIRTALNQVLAEEGVPWAVYGESSFFYILTNPDGADIDPLNFDAFAADPSVFKADKREGLLTRLRMAMIINGVDLKGWRGGVVSAVHGPEEVAKTVDAWRLSLRMLRDEGDIA